MLTPRNHGSPALRAARKSSPAMRLCLSLFSLAVFSYCASCTDLTAVAKFADSAKSASTGFEDIAKDFAGSANRRAQYVSDAERQKVLERAEAYKAEEPDMLAADKVLTDYIAALAAIATDDSTKRDASAGATQGGLEKVGMTSDQATAGIGLAAKITDAALAAYRGRKVGKAIQESNTNLQQYLKGLEHITGDLYPLVLDNEKLSVEEYYRRLLDQYGDKEPLAAVLIQLQKKQDLAAIEKKRDAAKAYVKILTDIGDGHQKLYDAGEHSTAKQIISILEPYIQDIATQSVNVAKAY